MTRASARPGCGGGRSRRRRDHRRRTENVRCRAPMDAPLRRASGADDPKRGIEGFSPLRIGRLRKVQRCDSPGGIAGIAPSANSARDARPLVFSLQTPDGGLDLARVVRQTQTALPFVPRFRQRLAAIPLFGRPVWVDDEHFNLHYHLRHAALPRPGDVRQLKRLAARILAQQLDRALPIASLFAARQHARP